MRDAKHGKDGARWLHWIETNAVWRRAAIVSLAAQLSRQSQIGARRSGVSASFAALRSGRPDRSGL